jgi:hypothetical protein
VIIYVAEHRYMLETLWWVLVLAIAGKIVNLLLNRPPRSKEKKP